MKPIYLMFTFALTPSIHYTFHTYLLFITVSVLDKPYSHPFYCFCRAKSDETFLHDLTENRNLISLHLVFKRY